MGYGLRYFIAADDGALTRVPTARYHRWFSEGEPLPADRVGCELKVLEAHRSPHAGCRRHHR